MTKPDLLLTGDLNLLWSTWNSRLVYCALLATGIWLSMLRRQSRSPSTNARGQLVRLRKIAGVWTFFGLINIFNLGTREIGLEERWHVLRYLVGL